MIPTPSPASAAGSSAPRRESADSVLAKNLVAARVIAGMTQQELASAAMVSRATIAQLETGYSDPRLSTIVDLAQALGIPPIFLLIGIEEAVALAGLADPGQREKALQRLSLSPQDSARMQALISSGLLKDRLRAAQLGASLARDAGHSDGLAPIATGLFSALLPGEGPIIGATLAETLNRLR